jgi:hypothetical protein
VGGWGVLVGRGAGSVLVGVVFGGGWATGGSTLRAATGMLAVSESGEGVANCAGWVQEGHGYCANIEVKGVCARSKPACGNCTNMFISKNVKNV